MPSPAKGAALYFALRTFLDVGGRLPFVLTKAVGPMLSGATLRLMPGTQRRIQTHLEIAFPELGVRQRDVIMRGCSRHFGLMLAEVARLWRAEPEEVETSCEIDGLEHFHRAFEDGRGVMFVTAHCGNWELLSARLPVAGVPLISAVRELADPRLDSLVKASRTRFGTEIVPRGPAAGRQMARGLARRKACGLLIDQDIRDVPGVFVPFFGRPAWTPSGAATLAIRMRCPLIPGFIHRRTDGSHIIEIHPPLVVPSAETPEDQVLELTAAATAAIERQIRAYPEQWVWMHRRWRRQPETL
ncbi:MAG: lysophospholipid acyltransferase family protein [Acidobacteriota bacterium]|nr:lysophospholipid acyltransferase family protein [Acidobacteriota bacterium]